MTTAVLAQNEASSAAPPRVALPWPSARALALTASIMCHAGVAGLAYAHAAQQPSTRPALEASHAVIEIAIAPSAEPDPVLEPPPSAVRETTPAVSAARSVRAAVAVVSAAPAPAPLIAAAAEAANSPRGSAPPATPHFVMQAPAVSAGISAQPVAEGAGSAASPAAAAAPIAESQVDSPAKLQAGTPPAYTAAAEAAGVEVELPLELVIDATGAVQSARTLEHVGYGLDEAAVAAVRRYRFSPARRAGSAVAVRMRWLLRFQLR